MSSAESEKLAMPPFKMPSNICTTHISINYLCRVLLGFTTFIILCSIKVLQIMQQEVTSRVSAQCFRWTEPLTVRMLNLLIEQRQKMGSKFNGLKKKYKAIERYNKSSGCCPWDDEFGANIDEMSKEDVQSWEQYLAITPSNVEHLIEHHNTRWLYYSRMKMLDVEEEEEEVPPEGALASQEVNYSDLFTEEQYAESSNNRIDAGTMSTVFDLDPNNLMGLDMDITLPDPTIQYTALRSVLSMLKQLPVTQLSPQGGTNFPPIPQPNLAIPFSQFNIVPSVLQSNEPSRASPSPNLSQSGKHPASDMSIRAPSSSRTSLLSSASKAVKSMPCGRMSAQGRPASKPSMRTSAQDISASSAIPSKRSKDMHSTGTATAATDPPPPAATPLVTTFRSTAVANLNQDTASIPSKVRSKLAIEFISNEGFCQTYAELMDSQVRCEVALDWYKSKFGPLPAAVALSSSNFTPSTSDFSPPSSTFCQPSSAFSQLSSAFSEPSSMFSPPASVASSSTSPGSSLFAGYDVGVNQYSCYPVDTQNQPSFDGNMGPSADPSSTMVADAGFNMDYSVYDKYNY
ncbi:hypothetical protein JVT61DRAFT_9941 [Boletus reticuloceps]|uniref:Uncharacterized protein n=1 Tax=Boletus reticuloceps TaxID=495285 RepID=A0A8I2YG00_9AGAM|nr:hypothetical protein JVT61DRAFT_9941 [Boletus reticuloceps]